MSPEEAAAEQEATLEVVLAKMNRFTLEFFDALAARFFTEPSDKVLTLVIRDKQDMERSLVITTEALDELRKAVAPIKLAHQVRLEKLAMNAPTTGTLQ